MLKNLQWCVVLVDLERFDRASLNAQMILWTATACHTLTNTYPPSDKGCCVLTGAIDYHRQTSQTQIQPAIKYLRLVHTSAGEGCS